MIRKERTFITGAGLHVFMTAVFWICAVLNPQICLKAAVIYGGSSLLLFAGIYFFISREIRSTLQKLDDSIQSLIDGNPRAYFSEEEDSLLGKFQFQVQKLYEILCFGKKYEKQTRETISSLIADLVHQMNTPLANVQMYCELLERGGLEKETEKKFLHHIRTQAGKLSRFGERFDKAARLGSGVIQLKPVCQPVLPAVLEAINQIAVKAGQKGNEIILEGDQNIRAYCDLRWTEEAVFNVLDNAVKYGAESRPIAVRMTEYDLYMRIDVENEGNPIPSKEKNEIFKRFYRGKNADRILEGVGLGLYLTREIIAGQGGYVTTEDTKDGGSRFCLWLRRETQSK